MMSGLVVPDRAGEVIGWRGWRVRKDNGLVRLLSFAQFAEWPAREVFEATCGKSHEPPGARCSCGIYAARTLDHLREMGYVSGAVFGQVSLWGTIVEGEQGWRAQYAYPRQLFLPHYDWRLVRPLRELYGIPAKLKNPYGEREA